MGNDIQGMSLGNAFHVESQDILQQIVIRRGKIMMGIGRKRIHSNRDMQRTTRFVIGAVEITAVISVVLDEIKANSSRETRRGPVGVQQLVYPHSRD